MSKNIHSSEMHRLADASIGTRTWVKDSNGKWVLTAYPRWIDDINYIIEDEWADIRKAMIDGKIIEFNHNLHGWIETTAIIQEVGIGRYANPIERYRIKPDTVKPTYYYQYERLYRESDYISISEHVTDKRAIKSAFTEAEGWFKIESSKREWKH